MQKAFRLRTGLALPVLCTVVAIATGCGDGDVVPRLKLPDGSVVDVPDVDAGAGAVSDPDASDDADVQPDADATVAEPDDPQDDLAALIWAPHFEPDYNNLVPQPWVEPVSKLQQDTVIVRGGELEFSLLETPEVVNWEVGRVIVSAPGEGAGQNPLGFARRVVSVRIEVDKIIVTTESVELEDIVSGDFQATFDPAVAKDVDLTKLDLDWAAANLYVNPEMVFMPGEPLLDDSQPLEDVSAGGNQWGFGSVFKAIGGAVKAVANVAQTIYSAVTPPSFSKTTSLTMNIAGETALPLFSNMNYKKQIKGGKFPMELFIKGSADLKASALVNPGFQVGASVPNILHKNPGALAAWVNVDARAEANILLNFALEAGIASAAGKSGDELTDALEAQGDLAQDVLGNARKSMFGDPDMKPAGGWRKPIFITKPKTTTIMAGPVPVVIVNTAQLDLECGFEAKASITGSVDFKQAYLFKFTARYEKGGSPTLTPPVFEKASQRNVQVLGGGALSVTCGLIPRINTMIYDTAGVNVGLRGSLVARAGYESKCAETTTTPKGEVAIGLDANVGLQIGARLQVPGSSYAGTSGQKAGYEIGPLEPWNKAFPIYEKTWQFSKGLGYCTPLCKNGALDGNETDVDCGGGACQTCATGKRCTVNSDCANGTSCSGGKCAALPCFDGVRSGLESDVDCGGSCAAKCSVSKSCQVGSDCESGSCFRAAGYGAGVCVASHCANGVRDQDESGVDCGGATCGKCQNGKLGSVAADCQSGISDGSYCVAATCADRKVSADESDIDCGGSSGCRRCGVGLSCSSHNDCSFGPHNILCVAGKCARPSAVSCNDLAWTGSETDVDCGGSCGATCSNGLMCKSNGDCASSNCLNGRCVECTQGSQCTSGVCGSDNRCAAATCNDQVKNGDETDSDCGGSCNAKCSAGHTCSVAADCTTALCSNGTCQAPPTRIVFASSAMYTGNLGGLSGADEKCQTLANAARLVGTYKAFLSDATQSASARLSHSTVPYTLVNGTVVAADANAFFSGAHSTAIVLDESGQNAGGEVWTGSVGSGFGSGGCSNWSSTTGTAIVGLSFSATSTWASTYLQFCDRNNVRLYCVQQD